MAAQQLSNTRRADTGLYAVQYADPAEVVALLATYDPRFAQCRDWGHTWRPYKAEEYAGGAWDRIMKCRCCSCLRTEELDSRDFVIARHYEYPDGYLVTVGRIDPEGKAAIRSSTRGAFRAAARAFQESEDKGRKAS